MNRSYRDCNRGNSQRSDEYANFLQFVSSPPPTTGCICISTNLVGKLMMEVLNLNIGLGQVLHSVLNELLFFLLTFCRFVSQLHKDDQDL